MENDNIEKLIEKVLKQDPQRTAMQAEWQEFHNKMIADGTIELLEVPKKNPIFVYFRRFRLAAALLVLIIAAGFYWQKSQKEYYDEVYVTYQLPLSPDILSGEKGVPQTLDWQTLYEYEQFDKVIPLLQKCLADQTCNPFAKTFLGLAYMKTGQIDKAIPCFQETLDDNPTLFEARKNILYYNIALCHVKNRDIKAAIKLLDHTDKTTKNKIDYSIENKCTENARILLKKLQ